LIQPSRVLKELAEGLNDAYRDTAPLHAYTKFRTLNIRSVNALLREFEMRKAADTHARSRPAKSGDIDTNRLHKYLFSDDVFKRKIIVSKGKNHGLQFLIDMSGSMTQRFLPVVEELCIMIEFCHRANIPFEVYGFSDGYQDEAIAGRKTEPEYQINDIVLPQVANLTMIKFVDNYVNERDYRKLVGLLLIYAEKTSGRRNRWDAPKRDIFSYLPTGAYFEFNGKAYNYGLAGTPLAEALYVMGEYVKEFREKNKVQISNVVLLTDGDGTALTTYVSDTTPGAYYKYKQENLLGYVYGGKNKDRVVVNDRLTNKVFDYKFYGRSIQLNAFAMSFVRDRIEALDSKLICLNLEEDKKRALRSIVARNIFAKNCFQPENVGANERNVQQVIDNQLEAVTKKVKTDGFASVGESAIYTHEFIINSGIGANHEEEDESAPRKYNADDAAKTSKALAREFAAEVSDVRKGRLLAVELSKLIAV
jgi:hypothetical protein